MTNDVIVRAVAGLVGSDAAYSQLADERAQRRRAGVGQELLLVVCADVVEQRTSSDRRLAKLERLDRSRDRAVMTSMVDDDDVTVT